MGLLIRAKSVEFNFLFKLEKLSNFAVESSANRVTI